MDSSVLAEKMSRLISPQLAEFFLEGVRTIYSDDLPDLTRTSISFHYMREVDIIVTEWAEVAAKDIANKESSYTVKSQKEDSETSSTGKKATVTIQSRVDAEEQNTECQLHSDCKRDILSKSHSKFSYINNAFELGFDYKNIRMRIYGGDWGFSNFEHLKKKNGLPVLMSPEEIHEKYEIWKNEVLTPILVALEERLGDAFDEIDKMVGGE